MSTLSHIQSIHLLAALTLLAALLAMAPTQARAAGAVLCNTNSTSMNRAPLAQATESHQAGLVIDFGDGRVMTFCIDLGADGQATGEELLRASNLPVIFEYSGGIGGAVCKIDTVGSDFPSEPCFSHCTFQPGETCMYWSYSQLVGDHWQFSQMGASSTMVHSGDVYGWAWGESTIAQRCPAAAAHISGNLPTRHCHAHRQPHANANCHADRDTAAGRSRRPLPQRPMSRESSRPRPLFRRRRRARPPHRQWLRPQRQPSAPAQASSANRAAST